MISGVLAAAECESETMIFGGEKPGKAGRIWPAATVWSQKGPAPCLAVIRRQLAVGAKSSQEGARHWPLNKNTH
jgi:hypothetical protein